MTDPIKTAKDALAAAGPILTAARSSLIDLGFQLTDAADAVAAMVTPDPFALVDKTGATDVTDALQRAINLGLAIPSGRYLVDAEKGLTATRNMIMATDAVLVAKANSAPRYCILDTVPGVTITGGQIIGDRAHHTYIAGSTSEWGCGVTLRDGCTLDGLQVSECTGDGIEVVGANVTIKNTLSAKNRRQGMSVFTAPGLKVYDSEFSLTGALGTDPAAPNGPCAGVDIEPDKLSTVDAWFERCRFISNRAGVLAWLRAEVGGALNITIKNCTIAGNANGVDAKALAGTTVIKVISTAFNKNTGAAVKAEFGSTVYVGSSNTSDANTIVGMGTRVLSSGTGVVTKYDLQAVGPTPLAPGKIVAGVNNYG